MRNIKLTIAYDGTGYGGWQRQINATTIQGEIEQRLETMTAGKVSLLGAGRTDAGVHAVGMVANFHTEKDLSCEVFLKGLNALLPARIRILSAEEVSPEFHSRFSARYKTYTYRLYTGPVQLPSERLYAFHLPFSLDSERIEECLAIVRGTHDFASFEMQGSRDRNHTGGRGSIRTIITADFVAPGNHHVCFSITGDGFLRKMVRTMVGTILDAGRKKISIETFQNIFDAHDRTLAAAPAPAHGLFLEKIFY